MNTIQRCFQRSRSGHRDRDHRDHYTLTAAGATVTAGASCTRLILTVWGIQSWIYYCSVQSACL